MIEPQHVVTLSVTVRCYEMPYGKQYVYEISDGKQTIYRSNLDNAMTTTRAFLDIDIKEFEKG
jgi:hypothetical protein